MKNNDAVPSSLKAWGQQECECCEFTLISKVHTQETTLKSTT